MKTKAIIQARCGSTRLPGKVLLKVLDKTILEYVIERVKKAKNIENIIVATTVKKKDLQIVNLAKRLGITVYRGSENDVLDRYYQAARLFKVKHIVRITADCPLIDPQIIDDVINYYFESGADYCNSSIKSFPDGVDVEIFSSNALNDAWQNAKLLSEREHVTPYITKHADRFKLASFENKIDLSGKRWTLDRKEDFEFIRVVLESLYPGNPDFGINNILEFLKRNPHIEDINKGIPRDERYLESLKRDRVINIDYTGK